MQTLVTIRSVVGGAAGGQVVAATKDGSIMALQLGSGGAEEAAASPPAAAAQPPALPLTPLIPEALARRPSTAGMSVSAPMARMLCLSDTPHGSCEGR